jgi:hypothetical protein
MSNENYQYQLLKTYICNVAIENIRGIYSGKILIFIEKLK